MKLFWFSREFEELAIGVLTVFDKSTRNNVKDVLVIRYIEDLNMDCLELAVYCKCKKFVSNSIVQSILDDIWNGKKSDSHITDVGTFNQHFYLGFCRRY